MMDPVPLGVEAPSHLKNKQKRLRVAMLEALKLFQRTDGKT